MTNPNLENRRKLRNQQSKTHAKPGSSTTFQKGSFLSPVLEGKVMIGSGNKRVGYARVSTDSQSTDQQVYELKKAGCSEVFVDEGVRATAKIRPGLEAAKSALLPGDVFVVWAIDRAFRSTLDAILFLDGIMKQEIAFQSLTQSIDTRTPEGRKWYIDTASWAEYEREIISRRTRAKMAEAKRRGVRLGRPPLLDQRAVVRAQDQISKGATITTTAARLGVAPITLSRSLDRFRCGVSSLRMGDQSFSPIWLF